MYAQQQPVAYNPFMANGANGVNMFEYGRAMRIEAMRQRNDYYK